MSAPAVSCRPALVLRQWLASCEADFSDHRAQHLIAELLAHAQAVRSASAAHTQRALEWERLGPRVRLIAVRRQTAAFVARMGQRCGLSVSEACCWTARLGGSTRAAYAQLAQPVLKGRETLFTWQWQHLYELGLRDDFVSARLVRQYLEADEPHVLSDRWALPLHLVCPGDHPSGAAALAAQELADSRADTLADSRAIAQEASHGCV